MPTGSKKISQKALELAEAISELHECYECPFFVVCVEYDGPLSKGITLCEYLDEGGYA